MRALEVVCPFCKAEIGEPCRKSRNRPHGLSRQYRQMYGPTPQIGDALQWPHTSRWRELERTGYSRGR